MRRFFRPNRTSAPAQISTDAALISTDHESSPTLFDCLHRRPSEPLPDFMTPARWLNWRFFQQIARFLGATLFDLKVDGLENIPLMGGALIACNHQSCLDPVILGARTPRPLNYFAMSELFENPFADRFLRSLGGFPVHLGAGDVGAVRQSIQLLREGRLLAIFPEGSRTENGELLPIQKGISLIDRRADVPIIPAVISGAFEAWPITRRYPKPWPVRVRFGPAMNLADMDADQIVATVDQTLRTMFDQLRGER